MRPSYAASASPWWRDHTRVTDWPLHDITLTNIVWCLAHKRGVGEGGAYIANCAICFVGKIQGRGLAGGRNNGGISCFVPKNKLTIVHNSGINNIIQYNKRISCEGQVTRRDLCLLFVLIYDVDDEAELRRLCVCVPMVA